MGFFKRVFQRRSNNKTDGDYFLEESSSDPKESQQKGQRSRSNTPEGRDEGGLDSRSKTAPVDTSESYLANQLSRISEEPTLVSSTTAGSRRATSKPTQPPSAREAAFHGPPRFDWMDIETSAAIKVQSIYRRNKVMDTMDKRGYSTSAIRNRKRRRKASRGKAIASADVPSFLSCCAVGLAFGEATEEDDEAYREFQKRQYEERAKQQQVHEEALRKQYLRSRGTAVGNVVEQIEVVE